MALNKTQVTTAINDYGPMAQIVAAVPELQGILSNALTSQMSPNAFTAAVQASKWYQTHGDAYRNLLMTQAADPATYNRTLANAVNLVNQTAAQMGRQVDANSMAYTYLINGWTPQTLQSMIGLQGGITHGDSGAYTGDAANLNDHMHEIATSYGVPFTQQWLDQAITQVQAGRDSIDGFTNVIRNRAKMAYPQYAAQIDAGQTMTQIADPYMAQMAKTLEIPQTEVTLNDPYIQKALSQRDPQSGAVTSQPLWAFNQTLKQDPRYDKTDQAKTDAYSTLAQVGKDFGFAAGAAAPGVGQ